MTKNYTVVEQRDWFRKIVRLAIVARLFAVGQSAFFFIMATTLEAERDRWMLNVKGLPAPPSFVAAGVVGLIMLLVPHRWFKATSALWLLLVGLACVGRTFTIGFTPEAFTFDERLRAIGWLLQWLGSVMVVVFIPAARAIGSGALGGDRTWSG